MWQACQVSLSCPSCLEPGGGASMQQKSSKRHRPPLCGHVFLHSQRQRNGSVSSVCASMQAEGFEPVLASRFQPCSRRHALPEDVSSGRGCCLMLRHDIMLEVAHSSRSVWNEPLSCHRRRRKSPCPGLAMEENACSSQEEKVLDWEVRKFKSAARRENMKSSLHAR